MTESMAQITPRAIRALTGIRAVAAAWVLLEHFQGQIVGLLPAAEPLRPWLDTGFLGVEVFFVLSGFIISYNYAADLSTFDGARYRDFLTNRFARIYPVHLFTLLCVAALVALAAITGTSLNSQDSYGWASFLGNLVVLQGTTGIDAWNGASWSISAEMFAYLAFPLVAIGIARCRRPGTTFMLAAGWSALGLAAMMTYRLVDASAISPAMILLRIVTEFTVGCLLWKAWSLAGSPQDRRGDVLAVGAFVGVALALWFIPEDRSLPLLTMPGLALFVFGCAVATGPVARLLSTAPMEWAGRVSYSLYMTHYVVAMVAGKVLPWQSYAGTGLPVRVGLVLAYFAACFLAAWLCYRLVEEPGRRVVRRVTGHPPARRAQSDRTGVVTP